MKTVMFGYQNPVASPQDGGRVNLLNQYRNARSTMLSWGYDAILTVEDDLLPPPEALRALWELNSDIAYAPYLFRRRAPYRINISRHIGDSKPGMPLSSYPTNNIQAWNAGSDSLSNYPTDYFHAWDAGIAKCSGVGLGCTLIRRRVLEELDFRHAEPDPMKGPHCDSYFRMDAWHAGFSMMVDFRVACSHILPDESIITPTRHGWISARLSDRSKIEEVRIR